ncbi:hypothetical protein [Mesorhizobium sp. 8]|uniref:hypothetical protein n=1 Tax=Mesorhizobium sp. 8 TaxID=2584466 RepID=UPI0011224CB1|nr:hypothetical protein [Mesorhizobium sp. 8]QDB99466.1 hypothetical protein FGU64_03085 [Mesorhizobium sp. 8]
MNVKKFISTPPASFDKASTAASRSWRDLTESDPTPIPSLQFARAMPQGESTARIGLDLILPSTKDRQGEEVRILHKGIHKSYPQ